VTPRVVEIRLDGTSASVASADAGLVGPALTSPVMLFAAPAAWSPAADLFTSFPTARLSGHDMSPRRRHHRL
jgi:hypothetical protein